MGTVTDHSIVRLTQIYVAGSHRPLQHHKSRDVKVPGLDPPYPKADDQGSNGEQPDDQGQQRGTTRRVPTEKEALYASLALVPMLARNALVLSRLGPPGLKLALYARRLTCVPALCKSGLDRR